MIEWCEDLDYEKYMNNWYTLATSAYVGVDKAKVVGNQNLAGSQALF